MQYTNVRNCKWVNEEHTILDCEVNFSLLEEEYVPFTAMASGDTHYSHEIFERALNGEFGEIQDYTPPPEPTLEELEFLCRSDRNQLLAELDTIVSNPLRWNTFTSQQQQQYAEYRQLLLDVPQQQGFPSNVIWPQKP